MNSLSFIGVGNMAGAIIRGITAESSQTPYNASAITLYDVLPEKTAQYASLGMNVAVSIPEAVLKSEAIILSVKPQQYGDVLGEIRRSGIDLSGKTFISLAAGIDTSTVEAALGGNVGVVRTMPNTPLLIGEGMTALCRNGFVSDTVFDDVCRMFSARGRIVKLDEENMNRVIAVNSSSIACFYRMIRALSPKESSPVSLGGLDEKAVRMIAAQAALGAARMVLENENVPLDDLIRMVTSYKGTTEQMMLTMDHEDFDGMMERAAIACTNRADELGKALRDNINKANA